jgi:hypothetical protein
MVFFAGFVCIASMFLQGCSQQTPSDEEQKALSDFQAVQQNLESNGSPAVFVQLLGQAESQLSSIKHAPKTIPCLVASLDKCLAYYQLIDKALKTKLEVLDEKRRQELDMAVTSSMAFSALSIQQAVDCCR